MRAYFVETFGDPSTMTLRIAPEPVPRAHEVLIAVEAAGCNFFDILIIQGKYQLKPPFPFGPGAEVAGVVKAVGQGVSSVAVGDRVLALLDYGGFATHVVARHDHVFRIPDEMPFDEAAALGIVYSTSYVGLIDRADLIAGETLLVHAAAGGVGLAAVEIGRALGARVIGTVGSMKKADVVKARGAEHVFSYDDADWYERVQQVTDGRGVDVIYDPVGGEVAQLSLKCIAFGGRHVVVGFASGNIPEFAGNRILLKNIAVTGLHWGAYWKHAPQVIGDSMTSLFALYTKGAIKPLVSATYPFAQAAQALDDLAARRTVGKVVIQVGGST